MESIHLVKDFLIRYGGCKNVPLTNKPLLSCKQAYGKYKKDNDEKKQIA